LVLQTRRFREDEIRLIAGENVARVLDRTLP
jgi:hypothetical protein